MLFRPGIAPIQKRCYLDLSYVIQTCWELLKRLSVVPAARVKLFLLIVYAVPAAYVIPAAPDFVSAAYSKLQGLKETFDILHIKEELICINMH